MQCHSRSLKVKRFSCRFKLPFFLCCQLMKFTSQQNCRNRTYKPAARFSLEFYSDSESLKKHGTVLIEWRSTKQKVHAVLMQIYNDPAAKRFSSRDEHFAEIFRVNVARFLIQQREFQCAYVNTVYVDHAWIARAPI